MKRWCCSAWYPRQRLCVCTMPRREHRWSAIYTISTNYAGMGNTDKNDKILERIADATGGRTFRPFQPQDVANAFAQIQDDLRSQYALSYRPADFMHDGRYRTIEIVADHKGLKVRSRHGYYAPAE